MKAKIEILKKLISIIELYGNPKKLRMDNEANFKSRIFRFGLFLFGIKPEYSEVACPWMNGRIERFFGTLKQHIRKIVLTQDLLEQRLIEFRYFYNHIRTHSNLNGKRQFNPTLAVVRNIAQRIPPFSTVALNLNA